MKNKIQLAPVAVFWTNAKGAFALISSIFFMLFLFTMDTNANKTLHSVLYKIVDLFLGANTFYLFGTLVSTVTLVLLVVSKNRKPKHEEFIFIEASKTLGTQRSWYDDDVLYLEYQGSLSDNDIKEFVYNLDVSSNKYKYDLVAIDRKRRLVGIKPTKTQSSLSSLISKISEDNI